MRTLTGINGCNHAFHNDDREPIKTCKSVDNLSDGGQLRNHVKEQGYKRHEAQVQHSNRTISVTRPLRQNESIGTLATDHGAKKSENKQGQRRRQCVNDDTLNTGNSCEFRVREQDTGSQGCDSQHDTNNGKGYKEGDLERQHVSHASINLIEYSRYNLSFVDAAAISPIGRK